MPGAVYVEYYWENREQRKLSSEATCHVVLAFLSVLSAHLAIPKDESLSCKLLPKDSWLSNAYGSTAKHRLFPYPVGSAANTSLPSKKPCTTAALDQTFVARLLAASCVQHTT